MIYVKVILVLLLPTLELAASGQYGLELRGGFPTCWSRAAFSAAEQGKRARMPDVRSFEESARLQNRRLGTQPGPSGFPVPVLGSAPQRLALGRFYLPAVTSEAAFGLAKCWQFQWRTALEPRAPSSAS
jgi:hypothetical protein